MSFLCSPRNAGLIRSLHLYLLFVVSLFSVELFAQDLRYMHHQAWSTETGLPQDSVHQIIQSSDGFIWIATEGGVARFDGITFKTFGHLNEPSFHSDDACCLANGRNGELWIGTADGLIRWWRGQWSRFDEKDGLPSSSIRALVPEPEGSLLVLTQNGLVEWKQSRFIQPKALPPNLQNLASAGHLGTWLLTEDRPVLWNQDRVEPKMASETGGIQSPRGISSGADGTLWTFSNSTVMASGKKGQRTWKLGAELSGSRIESLFVDRDGAAWVGTNDGLVRMTADSASTTQVEVLRGNTVLQVFQDRDGSYWVGTEASGLHMLRQVQFRNESGFMNKSLNAVIQGNNGMVWVGTKSDGLRRMRGDTIDQPVRSSELTSPVILSLAIATDGDVWVGTPDGLNRIRPNTKLQKITSADGLPDDYIQSLLAGANGSVWVGTRHGLVHIEGKRMKTLSSSNGISGDLIGALLPAKDDSLWVGTSGGLSHISANGEVATIATHNGLPAGNVTAIAEYPSGTIWVATSSGGISKLIGNVLRPITSVSLRKRIYAINPDGLGYLWLRTDEGVERIRTRELDACLAKGSSCDPHVNLYGRADGVPSVDLGSAGSPSIWKMANGEIWMATRRGMTVTNPLILPVNPSPPPVVIERFLADESPIAIAEGHVTVGPRHVRYTIEYVGLNYTAPSEVRYRFKLEGLDKDWTDAGGRRFATYTNLPGGNYRFMVQAANRDGVWSDAGAKLSFGVVPPFYKRWWFATISVLLVMLIAAGVYRLRLRQLELQYEAVLQERSRLAREIHDTLAQDFVGVSLQLDLVAQLLGSRKVDAALEQVKRARKVVTDGLAEARQSIWELRTNLPENGLPIRLRQIVKRYSSESVTVRLKIGGVFRSLDPRIESEVLRIAQEALSNMQRHADASNASIELSYGSDLLMLIVQDNGRGFVTAEASRAEGHYGLRGMVERASLLQGSVDIVSAPGDGTRISISVPIGSAKE